MSDKLAMQDLQNVLTREGDTDFVLADGQSSVWITVDDVSVHILRTDEGGVRVSLYPVDEEMEEPLDECGALRLTYPSGGRPARWRTGK